MTKLDLVLPIAEQSDFERSLLSLSPRAIRLHVDCDPARLPFATECVPWSTHGRLLLDPQVRPSSFLEYATADYYIQDAGSLLPIRLLDIQPHETVLDLCAAPGGKASAIAEQLSANGCLVANENIQSRVDVLRYSLARTQRPFYLSCSHDPTALESRLRGAFDAILVDAPCSGQMLVSKSKHDDNAFSPKHIAHCASRQQRILRSAVSMLRPGGRLVYSTCTFAVEENEDQMSWLCNEFPGAFAPLECDALSRWRSPLQPGCYRLWPHRDPCAGGFAAGLRLVDPDCIPDPESDSNDGGNQRDRGSSKGKQSSKPRKNEKKGERDSKVIAQLTEQINELGSLSHCELMYRDGNASVVTKGTQSFLDNHPEFAAVPMPALISVRDHWIPSHALSLLNDYYFQPKELSELDDATARQYVLGNSLLPNTQSQSQRGWHVVTHHGRRLGWVKASDQRWNNHLPAWARLNSLS